MGRSHAMLHDVSVGCTVLLVCTIYGFTSVTLWHAVSVSHGIKGKIVCIDVHIALRHEATALYIECFAVYVQKKGIGPLLWGLQYFSRVFNGIACMDGGGHINPAL